jgi:hypothetical protein
VSLRARWRRRSWQSSIGAASRSGCITSSSTHCLTTVSEISLRISYGNSRARLRLAVGPEFTKLSCTGIRGEEEMGVKKRQEPNSSQTQCALSVGPPSGRGVWNACSMYDVIV